MASGDELVRRVCEAIGRGDVAALLPLLADNVTWKVPGPPAIPYAGLRHGPGEVERLLHERDEIVVYERFEVGSIVTEGNRAVATGFCAGGAKTTSGLPFAYDWAMELTLRGDRVETCREYADTAALVAAIGGPSV